MSLTSPNAYTHVASGLLSIRFLDIYQALHNDIQIEIEALPWKNTISVLKKNVRIFNFSIYPALGQLLLNRTLMTGWKRQQRLFPFSNPLRPAIA